MIKVKIKKSSGASTPLYQSRGASGADVCANPDRPVAIDPGGIALVPTGLFVEIPEGYEAQIRPRSGLALKHGITLLNTPGTIDSDYRGEVKIIVANFGKETFTVEKGMRIAQMVFCRIYKGEFIESDDINKTDRSDGGFGHTGI